MITVYTLDSKRGRPPSLNTRSCIRGFWWYGISKLVRLGSRASTENKLWANYEQLFRLVFPCSKGRNVIFFWKYCSVHTKKLHDMIQKKNLNRFFWALPKLSKLNVLHKCRTGYLDWGKTLATL